MTRGKKHCAMPGLPELGVPIMFARRGTQCMWWRPVPVPTAMPSRPYRSQIARMPRQMWS